MKQASTLYKEAFAAGTAAFKAAAPDAMVVSEPAGGPTWLVPDGPCGFAWVTIKPARGKFVTWLKANDIGSKGYYGGWQLWGKECGGPDSQSFERKCAAAAAFAEVLRANGINAYADGKLD